MQPLAAQSTASPAATTPHLQNRAQHPQQPQPLTCKLRKRDGGKVQAAPQAHRARAAHHHRRPAPQQHALHAAGVAGVRQEELRGRVGLGAAAWCVRATSHAGALRCRTGAAGPPRWRSRQPQQQPPQAEFPPATPAGRWAATGTHRLAPQAQSLAAGCRETQATASRDPESPSHWPAGGRPVRQGQRRAGGCQGRQARAHKASAQPGRGEACRQPLGSPAAPLACTPGRLPSAARPTALRPPTRKASEPQRRRRTCAAGSTSLRERHSGSLCTTKR